MSELRADDYRHPPASSKQPHTHSVVNRETVMGWVRDLVAVGKELDRRLTALETRPRGVIRVQIPARRLVVTTVALVGGFWIVAPAVAYELTIGTGIAFAALLFVVEVDG